MFFAAPLNVSPTTGNEKTPEKAMPEENADEKDMIMETAETLLALSGKKNEVARVLPDMQQLENSRNVVKELRAQRKIQKGM